MKLQEIIIANARAQSAIEYGQIHPYLKSLNTYYKENFEGEPILMVCEVMNAAQYVKIVDSNYFNEEVCKYIGCKEYEIEDNDDYLSQFETINFNSKLLKDLLA